MSDILLNPAGPCQTSTIEAIMDCEARSATISWQPSVGAVSYITELTAQSGHTTSCTTNHTNCELSSLQCGEQYNVTVKALGDACNNTAQMAGYLTTGTVCSPVCLFLACQHVIVFVGEQQIYSLQTAKSRAISLFTFNYN